MLVDLVCTECHATRVKAVQGGETNTVVGYYCRACGGVTRNVIAAELPGATRR